MHGILIQMHLVHSKPHHNAVGKGGGELFNGSYDRNAYFQQSVRYTDVVTNEGPTAPSSKLP